MTKFDAESARRHLRKVIEERRIPLPEHKFELLADFMVTCGDALPEDCGDLAARMVWPPSSLTLIDDAGVNVRRVEYGDGRSDTQVTVEGISWSSSSDISPDRLRALARAAHAAADIMAAVRGDE